MVLGSNPSGPIQSQIPPDRFDPSTQAFAISLQQEKVLDEDYDSPYFLAAILPPLPFPLLKLGPTPLPSV